MLTFTLSPADFFIFWKILGESKIQAIKWVRNHPNLPHLTLLSAKNFVEEMKAAFEDQQSFEDMADLIGTFESDLRFWHCQDQHKADSAMLAQVNRILSEDHSPAVRALAIRSASNSHKSALDLLNKADQEAVDSRRWTL